MLALPDFLKTLLFVPVARRFVLFSLLSKLCCWPFKLSVVKSELW